MTLSNTWRHSRILCSSSQFLEMKPLQNQFSVLGGKCQQMIDPQHIFLLILKLPQINLDNVHLSHVVVFVVEASIDLSLQFTFESWPKQHECCVGLNSGGDIKIGFLCTNLVQLFLRLTPFLNSVNSYKDIVILLYRKTYDDYWWWNNPNISTSVSQLFVVSNHQHLSHNCCGEIDPNISPTTGQKAAQSRAFPPSSSTSTLLSILRSVQLAAESSDTTIHMKIQGCLCCWGRVCLGEGEMMECNF